MSGRVIRKISSSIYKKIVKPIFFSQSPDDAHDNMIKTANILDNTGLFRILGLLSYRSNRLEQTIENINFKNPVGLSAGLDKNLDLPRVANKIGFGFMIGGSVTALPCEGNARPWFYRLPKHKSLVVNAGLSNIGVDKIIEKLEKLPKKFVDKFPIGISVAKTNNKDSTDDVKAIEDYVASLKKLKKAEKNSIYEINISCPNAFGGETFTTPERLDLLLSEINKVEIKEPIFIKMPIDKEWADFRGLLEVIVNYNIAGVTIGNLRKDRNGIDVSDEIKGGLSGKPTQDIVDDLIKRSYRAFGDKLIIIGVGGVFDAEDAYRKIRAGASLVALITALIFEGPQVVGEINEGLDKLLERDGFSSVSDAIGIDAIS